MEEDEHKKVITIAAVLLRPRPFLAVNGNMTLTSTRLMFLPDLQDPQVRKLGATRLQVDLPSANIRGVKRVKPNDLDLLISEDVGLSLQQDQRFLQVMYKSDVQNIVAAVRETATNARRRERSLVAEDCSLYFMLSPESLSLVRTQLVQRMEETGVVTDGVPELVGTSDGAIPTHSDLFQLRPHIPLLFRDCPQWYRRFCTRSDGISRSTMMNRIYDVAPLLLFVRTTKGDRFGVYFGDELHHGREYYGSDRTFIFRLGDDADSFVVWTASAESRYFLLLNDDGLSVGADASGCVSLYIDSELSAGETHRSEAFENDPLIRSGFKFDIACLEFFSFEPPDSTESPSSLISDRPTI